jgi:hypothetical protein
VVPIGKRMVKAAEEEISGTAIQDLMPAVSVNDNRRLLDQRGVIMVWAVSSRPQKIRYILNESLSEDTILGGQFALRAF